MHILGRAVLFAILSLPLAFTSVLAQQLDLGHQEMPDNYVGPSPVFPGYSQPQYQPPTYQPEPSYQSSEPQYLPSYGGGTAGSTFNPRY